MADIERRTAATEIRVEGRKLTGTVMRYGDVSPTHKERFEPGAFRLAETVILDVDHDRERAIAWTPGGGMELADGDNRLELAAELPPIPAADRALEEIKSGANGLSVEFRARKERRDGDIRVVEEAELIGVAVVASPSYELSRVEARRAKRRLKPWL